MPVADGLAQSDDIGDDALRLEAPEVRANASKTYLHLVCNADAARVTHVAVRLLEIVLGQHNLTTTAEQRFADEGGHASVWDLLNSLFDVARVLLARTWVGPFVLATVDIGHGYHVDVWRLARTTRAIEFVRADFDEGRRITVVGGIYYDDIFVVCMRACEPQRQFIRFAARTHKVAHAQRLGQRGAEAPGVAHEVFVQVACIGVEYRHLLLPRFDHAGMAVSNMTDVVDGVEVGTAILVVQVLHRASHDLERLLIRDAQRSADVLYPRLQDLLDSQAIRGKTLRGDARDHVGIGAQA